MTIVDNFSKLTLGVVTSKHLWKDPEGVKTTGGFGRQMEAFYQYFRKIILIVPFKIYEKPRPGYLIQMENLEIVPLPYFSGSGFIGKVDFLIKLPVMLLRILMTYKKCDIWQYRIPGYVGILGILIHKLLLSRPAFIWLCADWMERIRLINTSWTRRRMEEIARILQPWLVQDVTTFALGHLEKRYQDNNPYVHTTTSTTLSEKHIVDIRNTQIYSPVQLLFVGRLEPEKGVIYLIEALNICAKNNVLTRLTIVGNGTERKFLEKLIFSLGLQDQVIFTGFIPMGDELWRIYRQADIFVMPSLEEAQGKVQLEAMGAGLPIIATQVGGIPSIIKDGYNGLLVPPRSSIAIANAMQKLIEEPITRQQLSQSALAAARHYTIEEQTRVLMETLNEDLAKQGWI